MSPVVFCVEHAESVAFWLALAPWAFACAMFSAATAVLFLIRKGR